MDLDELRTVQSKERSKDSLQHLRESFYADVADYVADLRERRDRAIDRAAGRAIDDPEVRRLTDEIETAEAVAEGLYERRVGKVVKRASLAAMDLGGDPDGLTAEERELFDELVARIDANKQSVLDVLEGDERSEATATTDPASGDARTAPAAGDAGSPPATEDAGAPDVSPADVMGGDGPPVGSDSAGAAASNATGASESARPSAEAGAVVGDGAADGSPAGDGADSGEEVAPSAGAGADDAADATDPLAGLAERTTVRVTDDVGEIFGVDERTYDLASEDVVTLPAANAEPLVERGAAEKLE
ncbi:hypothetical protein [Halorussus halobius]|uniref:hypothetical protein n=1 Tax=Halorussus halobius TaxID=1710537 RepID=UPI0010930226|nr:hypothetical protein [Halorussus halobius]